MAVQSGEQRYLLLFRGIFVLCSVLAPAVPLMK